MMLIICDKNPIRAAGLVPDRLKFKQLLELCQMICSVGYSNIYKKIPQGKAIQEWIKRNPAWVYDYACELFCYCYDNVKMTPKTCDDIRKIKESLSKYYYDYTHKIQTAVFRYNKNYKGSSYPTDSELPIDVAVQEYKKYMEWKNGKK